MGQKDNNNIVIEDNNVIIIEMKINFCIIRIVIQKLNLLK